jgi:antitoxin component YwqK of YwqJK toxin-antitoxin module
MRNIILALCCCILTPIFAQKTAKHLQLPLMLSEYYSPDSMSFVYAAQGRLSSYSYCSTDTEAPTPGFSKEQIALVDLNSVMGGYEGSLAYMMSDDPALANKSIESMRILGLKTLPKILGDYSKFVTKNQVALTEGTDSLINVQTWYYDSLMYDAFSLSPDMTTIYNLLRNSNMFVRYDGKEFDQKANGIVRISNGKGQRIEEISLENGIPTGTNFVASAAGVPQYETTRMGDVMISRYYDQLGNLISYDSTNAITGYGLTRIYFPNGKINSVHNSSQKILEDGTIESGTTTEKAYFLNGKLSSETTSDYAGGYKILKAYNSKGKSTIEKGSGILHREAIDPVSGLVSLSLTEYSNHYQSGLNENYLNGVLINKYEIVGGLMNGSTKNFHWLNGKLVSETTYDQQGNYLEELNYFDQNAPKIDPKRIKLKVDVDIDPACNAISIHHPQFVAPSLKSEKGTRKMLLANLNALTYSADGLIPTEASTTRFLTIDLNEKGQFDLANYTDDDLIIAQSMQFNPATFQGKAIRSRVNILVTTTW